MNFQKKGAAEIVGFTNHLPDEILHLIFKKVVNLKTLFIIDTLISKTFSPMIPQIEHISLLFPPVRKVSNKTYDYNLAYLGKASRFLAKFSGILRFDIEIPTEFGHKELIKWKAVYGTNQVEKFVFLAATSISKKSQNMETRKITYPTIGYEIDPRPPYTNDPRVHICNSTLRRYFKLLFELVDDTLLSRFPVLDKVTISDPKKHGLISFSKKELIMFRHLTMSSEHDVFAHALPLTDKFFWCIEQLETPSGFVLEGVTLQMWGMGASLREMDGGYDEGDFDEGDVIPKELGVGDEVFGEVVKCIKSCPGFCGW